MDGKEGACTVVCKKLWSFLYTLMQTMFMSSWKCMQCVMYKSLSLQCTSVVSYAGCRSEVVCMQMAGCVISSHHNPSMQIHQIIPSVLTLQGFEKCPQLIGPNTEGLSLWQGPTHSWLSNHWDTKLYTQYARLSCVQAENPHLIFSVILTNWKDSWGQGDFC